MNDQVISCFMCDYLEKWIKNIQHSKHKKEIDTIKHNYMDKYICCICLDSNGELIIKKQKNYKIITPCGHIFHKQCLKKLLQTDYSKKCPNCRQKIKHYKIFL